MGINEGIFEALSDAELRQVSDRFYKATLRLHDTVMALFAEMSQMPTWTAEYKDKERRAAVLMAAGREQGQLSDEVGAVIMERIAQGTLTLGYLSGSGS